MVIEMEKLLNVNVVLDGLSICTWIHLGWWLTLQKNHEAGNNSLVFKGELSESSKIWKYLMWMQIA